MPDYAKNLRIAGLLALLVFAAYFNSLRNDFVSDDIAAISENSALTSTNYLAKDPLTFLRPQVISSAVKIFGLKREILRLINILFHLGTVLTAYFLMKRLAGAQAAFFCAAIFAVHPVLSESVAWISGGTYAQFNFFILLAFLFYVLALKGRKFYPFAIAAYLLGLLSTDRAIVFFPLALLYTISFRSLRGDWKKLAPFFILSCVWALHLAGSFAPRVESLQAGGYAEQKMLNPLIQIPVAVTNYLQLILWPRALTVYHSEMTFTIGQYIARGLISVFFAILIILSWRRSRQVFFWLCFFLINLLPALSPFGVSWIVAERYCYLASLGIVAIVSLGLGKIYARKKLKLTGLIIFWLIIAALTIRTYLRNIDWRSQDNLWLAAEKTSPSCYYNHNNLGDLYCRRGDFPRAVEEFKLAIALKPNYADAYHNLANTYEKMGSVESALENYQQAVIYNPNLWQSYQNLSAIYFARQNYLPAAKFMRKAAQINPRNPQLHYNLGMILLKAGESREARKELEQALLLDPQNQLIRQTLAGLQ